MNTHEHSSHHQIYTSLIINCTTVQTLDTLCMRGIAKIIGKQYIPPIDALVRAVSTFLPHLCTCIKREEEEVKEGLITV